MSQTAEEPQADIIRLLPDSVANQIAAGEVIQRPASVVKELVENSIDAGAGSIHVVIVDAGKTMIQIVDDGIGMSSTDARMAFERHATSKIRKADDLFTLHTMGFRGEALPSIAAVAEVEVTTKRKSDNIGTRLIIRGSKFDSQEPYVAPNGTGIKVKNLFFNFVARRRFLKKDTVELNQIIREFERLALVNTDVSFKLTSNNALLSDLHRGPLKDRITALFGKNIGAALLPVDIDTPLVRITGFISTPAAARARNQKQYLFVNGRHMRHQYFHKAILTCYDNLIAKDVQPHYFLKFEVQPDRIDVNIHPQKHEVKFEDEQAIWQTLTASIRETLSKYNVGASIEFDTIGAPEIPPLIDGFVPETLSDELGQSDYNPFEMQSDNPAPQQGRLDFGYANTSDFRASALNSSSSPKTNQIKQSGGIEGWDALYESLKTANQTSEQKQTIAQSFWQFRNKYILTETTSGIVIIDQHRAHINILFDKIMNDIKSGAPSTQSLIFNEPLQLDATQAITLDSSIETIERIGFRIGRTSEGFPALVGVPANIEFKNPLSVLYNILDDINECTTDVETDIERRIALVAARACAIKTGQPLTQTELEHIVVSLFKLRTPSLTPDGKTVIVSISDDRLASFFN